MYSRVLFCTHNRVGGVMVRSAVDRG